VNVERSTEATTRIQTQDTEDSSNPKVKKKEDARESRRQSNTSRYTDDSLIAVSLITDAYKTNEGEETERTDTKVTVAKTDVIEEELTAAESEEVEAAPESISAEMEESIRRYYKEKIESRYGLSGMDKLKSVVPVMLKDLRPRDYNYREKLYQFKTHMDESHSSARRRKLRKLKRDMSQCQLGWSWKRRTWSHMKHQGPVTPMITESLK
jgi:hypothetical protein